MRSLLLFLGLSALIFGLSSKPAVSAENNEMVPLLGFLAESDPEDPVTYSYILKRCAAAYIAVVKMLESSAREGSQELSGTYLDSASNLMIEAARAEQAVTTKSAERVLIEVKDQVVDIGNIYIERIIDARTRTGHGTNDPLFSGDLEFCRQMLSGEPSN